MCLEYRHPYVFFEQIDDSTFKGVMLSSIGPFRGDNIPLRNDHFKKLDESGNEYFIQNKPSFFPCVALVKRFEVTGRRKEGELTDEGINYIESTIEDFKPEKWSEYIKRNRNRKVRSRFNSKG